MLDAAVKALTQILSPPMRSILWRSIGLALVLVTVLAVGLQRLLSWFAVNGEVWLKVSDVQIFGIVRWVRGYNCGIVFDAPLSDRQLATFQSRGRTVAMDGVSREDQLGAEDWQAYAGF